MRIAPHSTEFPKTERQVDVRGSLEHPPTPPTSTTSFLTATTFIYAIGAGITAAAGTRLALQLFLDKGFKLFSLLNGEWITPTSN